MDVARVGALRFRLPGQNEFQAPSGQGVPSILLLGKLLGITERLQSDEDTDTELELLVAPGASLGGARPKASVVNAGGNLAVAKFPGVTDDYSRERWEAIALDLARSAGLRTASHSIIDVMGKPVFLSQRFDRRGQIRIPYVSAMTMTQRTDREQGSYLEIVDALARYGSRSLPDRVELYKRVAFSILISNTDDHLRNHGFLRIDPGGWTLAPTFDINPTPGHVQPRVLSTLIDFDNATCSVDLLRSVTREFSLSLARGDAIIAQLARATAKWRTAARRRNAPAGEINRMADAFEHSDLRDALALTSE